MLKKSIVAVMLVISLCSGAAAFAPLAIPAYYFTASLVLHGAAAAGAVYYAMKSGSSSTVAASGDVSRPSTVSWVDLTLPTPAVVEKNVTTKITKAQAESISTTKPTTYPNIKAATVTQTNAPVTSAQLNVAGYYPPALPIGTKITIGASTYQTTAAAVFNQHYAQTSYSGVPYAKPDVMVGSGYILFYTQTSGWWDQWKVIVTNSSPPTPVYASSTNEQFAASLAQTGTSGAVKSAYQAELDAMMQDPSYVPSFSDDTTGLPLAAPAAAATESQLSAYNNNGIAQESIAAASTAAASATRSAYLNYSSNKNASTKAAWDSAKATQASTAASGAVNAANTANSTNDKAADVGAVAAKHTIDMTPLHSLKGALDNTYPFNLPNVIGSYYSKFAVAPEAPSFTVPMPLGQNMTVDLAPFDPVAKVMRYLVGVTVTAGMLWFVVGFFRGTT